MTSFVNISYVSKHEILGMQYITLFFCPFCLPTANVWGILVSSVAALTSLSPNTMTQAWADLQI